MKNDYLVAGAVVFKKDKSGKIMWLLVKTNEDSEWEIAKTNVRKGESSVRAVLRMTGEQAGISAKVLEEAGRTSVNSQMNGKTIVKKEMFYLMVLKNQGENLAFFDLDWFDYAKVRRMVSLKKEKNIFADARKELEIWQKKQKQK